MKEFKQFKFYSQDEQEILEAVSVFKKLGYIVVNGYLNINSAKDNGGVCAWDDGEITSGWLDDGNFEQVTLGDLKGMVCENKEVLWLNKFTLEESYLKVGEHWRGVGWVKVPEGATFATGDRDNFIFRKDGWYYDNQKGWWIKGNVTIKNLHTHELVKLFWVKSDVKDNGFTLERLLGCEVEFSPFGIIVNGHISKVRNSGLVHVTCGMIKGVVGAKHLTFFTEDGDELTFDEYVKLYYGDNCE